MSNPAYFVPLVILWDVITGPGEYVTRCGEVVSIDSADCRAAKLDCLGSYADGTRERWHRSGRIMASREMVNDIVRATA